MSKTSITSNLPPNLGQEPSADDRTPAARVRNDSIFLTGIKALASLKLTVALFVLSIILVFCGTLAQIDEGIWTVVSKYFRSFYVWVPFQLFFPREWPNAAFWDTTWLPVGWVKWLMVHGGFPFVGGLTLGSLLMMNLLAAHAIRFKFKLNRTGVILLHAGIIVMMLGELITGQFAVEATMTIENGTSCNFVEERGATELAVIRHLDAKTDDVVVIPGKKLKNAGKDQVLANDALPFDVKVVKFMVNSAMPQPVKRGDDNPDAPGAKWRTEEKREGTGVDAEQRIDIASAYVTLLKKGTNEPIGDGTYLVSVWDSAFGDQPTKLVVDDKQYDVYLRFKRTYKPYTITLNKFTHEVYPGTTTPKNFASTIQLEDSSQSRDLETTISMNNPLRYNGETFYQSGFLPKDQGTILQVVRNPGWQMPYISCVMVALGMLIHFGMTLIRFLATQLPKQMGTGISGMSLDLSMPSLLLPAAAVFFTLLYLGVMTIGPEDAGGSMRLHDFGKLPTIDHGRTKPIQTSALNDLLMVSNRRVFKGTDKQNHAAIVWLLEVMTSRVNKESKAEDYEVFRVDNEQVLNLLELPNKPEFYRYSIREMSPHFDKLEREVSRAEDVEHDKRTLFDIKVLELAQRVQLYIELTRFNTPNLVPPANGQGSKTLATALQEFKDGGEEDPNVMSLIKMLSAYAANEPKQFNSELDAYHERLQKTMPADVKKAEFEVFFNNFEPFYHCTILYVIAFVLGCASWIGFRVPLGRSAFWLCVVTFFLHTWAIGARMYIQDRPPVTNLYSSAIFVGWACVLLGLILEMIYRNAFGVVVSALTGFLSVIIAHNLSTDGDTMEMMQAVLDTNFWLATHVVIINIGYSATITAGFVGMAFIFTALLQYITGGAIPREVFMMLNRKLYGILCFATLCSFVGTVLGGIWADQSWGRFWGWDPKENGALMIVIMNALVLHARWGGLVQQRGVAVLAQFGNIITAWSWFGVNLLGVGLHAYGFMQGTFLWLMAFIAFELCVIGLGMMPFLNYWRTAAGPKPALQLATNGAAPVRRRR